MIPKLHNFAAEFSVLGRLLARARMLTIKTKAEAREVCGAAMSDDNYDLLEQAQEMPEAEGVVVMQYINARIWQEKIIDQRLEINVLNLNCTGELIDRHWNVANLNFNQMQEVYNKCKNRYHLPSGG